MRAAPPPAPEPPAPGPDETPGTVAHFRVRTMSAPDVAAVAALEKSIFTMPWSAATFRGLLRRRDVDALVAERAEDGAVVGYAVAWGVYEQGELANVAVEPAMRGAGLGPMLLEEVLRRLRERDVTKVFLEVRESNTTAQRLYQRFGFREMGRRRRYYERPREDALVYHLELEPRSEAVEGIE